jgi:hypothetical protein
VRDFVSSAEEYEEEEAQDLPFEDLDVAEVYDLEIDDEDVLACIAILMANVYRIDLVDGETGRDVD